MTKSSQKPRQLYELIERFCPKGDYLELFGRVNNIRHGWVTAGNEDLNNSKIPNLTFIDWSD